MSASKTLTSTQGTGSQLTISTTEDDLVDDTEVWIRVRAGLTGVACDMYVNRAELLAAIEDVIA